VFLNKNRGKRIAFTLIELMIVIAIIAILASVLVPNFAKSREKAKLEACKANLKGIAIAVNLYMQDNNNAVPPTGGISTSHVLVTQGYLKSRPLCPANPVVGTSYGFYASSLYVGDHYIRCNNSGGLWHPNIVESRPSLYLANGYFQ